MKLFITGGTGFIGRHVVRQALADGHQVVALIRPGSASALLETNGLSQIRYEMDQVPSSALEGCDALIHLAAHGVVSGMNDWQMCFKVNVHQSLVLWIAAADAGIKRFVICGSCFEYGRSGEKYDFIPVTAPLEPTSAYAASKASATMAMTALSIQRNLKASIIRPFHVYGEGEHADRFWMSLKTAAEKGCNFNMTRGEQIRDFVSVEYVAQRILKISTCNPSGSDSIIYNIGSGNPLTLNQFANQNWSKFKASGELIMGAIPYRSNEIMRYVPLV
ncbi:MAG: NAD(P)-dependent oxidoreductase [Verrucomicrobia bacterium]|nr:NAD(P)-dependent oxidoreductase [Verrucomicrobiota bacterium]